MCGIAGFSGTFDPTVLYLMNRAQAHRGPDDEGVWFDSAAGVGLGHRRLSIIDLSAAGHQPMWDVTRRCVITFNGEIYNYREMRRELEADGFRFRSKTDTEVILALYLKYGDEFVTQLNGIYAFALWDADRRQLLLARDEFGVKPLYYAVTPRGVAFASELKALMSIPGVDCSLDVSAMAYYISYLHAPPPHTPVRGIRKLAPGHLAVLRNGTLEKTWSFRPIRQASLQFPSPREAAEQTRFLLQQAVTRQMVADVPVGAFLSGGVDSSAIVAIARRQVSQGELQCFTVRPVSGRTEPGFVDDLPYARMVAQHLGVPLHIVDQHPMGADELQAMVFQLDEPIADPAALSTRAVCEAARQRGVSVLLSGTGADDLFSGYRRHLALNREARWSWLPAHMRRVITMVSQRMPPGTGWGRRVAKAFRFAHETEDRRLAGYFLWIDPERMMALWGDRARAELQNFDVFDPLLGVLHSTPRGADPLSRMLALDSSFFLTDQNLTYADRMSMACGVELRVPFLDPDLVSFATGVPSQLKQNGGTSKWVLKEALKADLPAQILTRPKSGFGVPLRRWLQEPSGNFVNDIVESRSLRERGLFDVVALRRLTELDRAHRVDASYPILAAVCIELWCRKFVDVTGAPACG